MKRPVALMCFLLALFLSACAFSSFTPPGATEPAAVGAKLSINAVAGQDYKEIVFESGALPAQDLEFVIYGVNLSVNDSTCKVDTTTLSCGYKQLDANKKYVIPVKGVLATTIKYKRSDGKQYSISAP